MQLNEFIYRPFADADETQQAALLNGLSLALLEACRWDEYKHESQLCYVAKHLDKHGEKMVELLAEFVEYRKEKS